MHTNLGRISSESVKKATGKSWDEWLKLLDSLGAKKMSHKEIAKMLKGKGYIKRQKGWPANRSFSEGWWAQMVTVGYEYALGKRFIGQTETQGFEIGVQKTLPISQKGTWELITSPDGLKIWLGEISDLKLQKGQKYQIKEKTQGEIRTVDKGTKLRLTWHPKFLKKPSTVQIYLLCPRNAPDKTNIRFHQEKLSSEKEREKMRKHWQSVLVRLEKLSTS